MKKFALLLLLGATPAWADGALAPRTIDFTREIMSPATDFRVPYHACVEQDRMTGQCKVDAPLTLGMLCLEAMATPDHPNMSPEEIYNQGSLASRIRKEAHAQVAPEELKLIERRLAAASHDTVMTAMAIGMLRGTK